jgi:hypothetical protein
VAKTLWRVVLMAAAVLAVTASAASAATLTVIVEGTGTVASAAVDGTKEPFTCANDGRSQRKECSVEYSTKGCPLTGCPAVTLRSEPARGFELVGWKGDCRPPREDPTACQFSPTGKDLEILAFFRDGEDPSVALGTVKSLAGGALGLRATADDNVGVSRVEFTVGGRTVVATADSKGFGASFDTRTVSDGAKTVTATAFDAAGNSAVSTAATVTIDNTKPALTVAGPDGNQPFGGGSTQRWTLSSSDSNPPVAVTCSLVPRGATASFGACTSSTSEVVSGKPDGAYVLTVRATDAALNTTDVTRTFVVDSVAPETTIASGIDDGGVTSDSVLTWTLASDEPGAAFACRVYPAALTPGDFAPCSAGASHTATGFAPGTYTFETRATDAAGNVDATPAKRTFTVVPPPPPPAPVVAAATSVAPVVVAPAAVAAGPAPQIVVTLAFNFNSNRKTTRLSSLVVKNVPKGSTVTAKCPKGCSAKSFKKKGARGKVSLSKLIKKPLKVGTKITVTISKPGSGSAIKTLKIRARKAPAVGTRCQPAGAAKPVACS